MLNNTELQQWIHYFDHEGLLHFFGTPCTRIFHDGTYYSPCFNEHRPLSPKHRKVLARYIETAEQQTYETEACR